MPFHSIQSILRLKVTHSNKASLWRSVCAPTLTKHEISSASSSSAPHPPEPRGPYEHN